MVRQGGLREAESGQKPYIHSGNSMLPTLRPLDEVYLEPCRRPARGDVVVFIEPGLGKRVVHRVIVARDGYIRTMGDNNPAPDQYRLAPDQIIGKVSRIKRNGRLVRVRGGTAGALSVVPHRAAMKLYALFCRAVVLPYHALAASGIFRLWLPERMRWRVLYFPGAAGQEMQLVIGKRPVGRYLPRLGIWDIRPPYRLFVDEAALPRGPATACRATKEECGVD